MADFEPGSAKVRYGVVGPFLGLLALWFAIFDSGSSRAFDQLDPRTLDKAAAELTSLGFPVHDASDQYALQTVANYFLESRGWPTQVLYDRSPDLFFKLLARSQSLSERKPAAELVFSQGFGSSASKVRISQDHRFVAVQGPGGVAIYETERGREIYSTTGQADHFEFLPRGPAFVFSNFGRLTVVDFERQLATKVIDTFQWNLTNNHAIAVDPTDGTRVAVYDGWANAQFSVAIVTTTGAGQIRTLDRFPPLLTGPKIAQARLAYSDDGKYLALATLVRVVVWEVGSGRRVADAVVPSNKMDLVDPELCFSADGNHLLALVGTDRRLVDIAIPENSTARISFSQASGLLRGRDGDIVPMISGSDGVTELSTDSLPPANRVLAGSWPIIVSSEGNRTVLRRLDRAEARVLGGERYNILGATYDRDTGRATAIDREGLRSIDIKTGQVSRTKRFNEIRNPVGERATLVVDDSTIVIVEDRNASVIDIASWRELASYPVPISAPGFYGDTLYRRVGTRLRALHYNSFGDGDFALDDFDLLTGRSLASWHQRIYSELCAKLMCPFDMGDEHHLMVADPVRKVWVLDAKTGKTATDVVGEISPEVAVEDLHPMRRQTVDRQWFQRWGFVIRPIFEKDSQRITINAADPRDRGVDLYYTYNLKSGELIRKQGLIDYIAERDSDRNSTIEAWRGAIARFDNSARAIAEVYDPHPSVATWAFEDTARDRVISIDAFGNVRISSRLVPVRLATLQLAADDNWIVATSHGYFDGTVESIKKVSLRLPSLEMLPIKRVMKAFLRPDLVEAGLNGDPEGKVAEEEMKFGVDRLKSSAIAPTVQLISQPLRTGDQVSLEAKVVGREFGIGRVEWRRNGIVKAIDELSGQETASRNIRREFAVERGINRFEVSASDASDAVMGEVASLEVDGPSGGETKPRLFVLAIGISQYDVPSLRLRFGASDAQAVARAFAARGHDLYEFVDAVELSDRTGVVSASAIETAFANLASKVGPNDTAVIFVAGHGKTLDGKFYFLPQKFRFDTELSITATGIPQSKWEDWLASVKAANTLTIFDACESGALTSLSFTTGNSAAALVTLARENGRAMFTAATSSERALEGYHDHGLFTGVLLEGLVSGDQSGDGIVDVRELANFLTKRVPAVARQIFGAEQYPQISIEQNFSLAMSGPLQTETMRATRALAPTHVVIAPTRVSSSADVGAPSTGSLTVGTMVRLISASGQFGLVAQRGVDLGFIDLSALAELH